MSSRALPWQPSATARKNEHPDKAFTHSQPDRAVTKAAIPESPSQIQSRRDEWSQFIGDESYNVPPIEGLLSADGAFIIFSSMLSYKPNRVSPANTNICEGLVSALGTLLFTVFVALTVVAAVRVRNSVLSRRRGKNAQRNSERQPLLVHHE
jgi:hypothetical protein